MASGSAQHARPARPLGAEALAEGNLAHHTVAYQWDAHYDAVEEYDQQRVDLGWNHYDLTILHQAIVLVVVHGVHCGAHGQSKRIDGHKLMGFVHRGEQFVGTCWPRQRGWNALHLCGLPSNGQPIGRVGFVGSHVKTPQKRWPNLLNSQTKTVENVHKMNLFSLRLLQREKFQNSRRCNQVN